MGNVEFSEHVIMGNVHPLASDHADFPWEQVFEDMDGPRHTDYADAREALLRVIRWITSDCPLRAKPMRKLYAAGLKAHALTWVLGMRNGETKGGMHRKLRVSRAGLFAAIAQARRLMSPRLNRTVRATIRSRRAR
jgi:hypothetical protein